MKAYFIFCLIVLSSCASRKSITPYDYALLSADVYDSNEVEKLPSYWERFQDFDEKNHTYGIHLDLGAVTDMAENEEWGKLVPYLGAKLFARGGYFGRAYIDQRSQQLVIAHRGTDIDWQALETADGNQEIEIGDQLWDIFKDLDDDYDIYSGKVPMQQLQAALKFVQATSTAYVEEFGHEPTIIHTGHSLGAVLAELCAISDGSQAVTFESPGTKPLADDLANYMRIEPQQADITIYNAEPNSINTLHEQSGRVIQLYKGKKKKKDYSEDQLIESLQHHSIRELLKRFDPKSGEPQL